MPHAVFAFDDADRARRVVDKLVADGVPEDAIRLNVREKGTVASGMAEADELATGGFITNFMGLLDGIFQRDQTPEHVKSFGVHLEQGGAVVCIDVGTMAETERIESMMEAEGCTHHSGWSRARVPAVPV